MVDTRTHYVVDSFLKDLTVEEIKNNAQKLRIMIN